MNSILKYFSHLLILSLIGILFCNGIGRDDKSLKEYFRFAEDSVFNCVGEFHHVKKSMGWATCVLIDKTHVLSVAHGFYTYSDSMVNDTDIVLGKKYPTQRPAYFYLDDPSNFYIKFYDKKFYIKKITIYPGFDMSYDSDLNNDISIVELTEPIDFIKPALLYTGNDELNSRGICCGFGYVKKAKGSNFRFGKGKKMAGENMIDSLGGYLIDGKWGALFYDMDHPNSLNCNRIGSSSPLPLEWRATGGDSGNGLFIFKEKKWYLAGIGFALSSFDDYETYYEKYGYYGWIDGWTRVSPLIDWIRSETNAP